MKLRPAFVVTASAMAFSCSSSCSTLRTRKASPPADSGKSVQSLDYATLKPLNPRDADGRVIYAVGEKCVVHVPRDKPQHSWQPPKQKQVDCPKSMDAAAWDQCSGGEILSDGKLCVCSRDGNPPPPPREISCP